MSSKWQQFIFCLLAQLVLPLLPLIIEWFLTGKVSNETWAISASMYIIAIGVSSKWLPILVLSIIVSMLFVSSFGFIKSGNATHFDVFIPAFISIISFLIIHGVERYFRHVKDGEIFISIKGDSSV